MNYRNQIFGGLQYSQLWENIGSQNGMSASILNGFTHAQMFQWSGDDCWTQAYSNDYSGREINGSLDQLVQADLAGKRVRVQIDSYIMDTDTLYIRNGHVSAQLLGQLTKIDSY